MSFRITLAPPIVLRSLSPLLLALTSACSERTTNTTPPPPQPTPVSITIAPRTASLMRGATQQFSVTMRDSNGRETAVTDVQWTSRDAALVRVDNTGFITAVAPGQTRIVATRGTLADSVTATVTEPLPAADVSVQVNTTQRTPISRFVYGMNLTTDISAPYTGAFPWYGARPPAQVTLDRIGGNRFTAYNWENNYSNAGADFNHQNDDFLSSSRRPGEAVRTRVAAARAHGAGALITVPMIGFVAADGNGPVDTLDASRGTRLGTRFRQSVPDKNGPLLETPDASDAFVYQDEFAQAMSRAFPGMTGDRVMPLMFSLDNEPDSWHATHKAIMTDSADNPNRRRLQTYEGFINTSLAYARAIKRVAPDAIVFGPATATYVGYLNLGRFPSPDPRYGTQSFTDVYIEQVAAAERAAGRRLIDVYDLHWYPAAGTRAGEILNDYATQDAEMLQARLQAPRSLWDATYRENSWVADVVGGPINMLPRLRETIAARNPGMRIAITEYYYGRAGDISGGVVQADLLGIFGREGVFAASLWPQAGVYAQPWAGNGANAWAYAFGAFRSYLDYDGQGARFGDNSVTTTVTDRVNFSAYGSIDAQNRVVMVVINKRATAQQAAIALDHPSALNAARAYVMRDGQPNPQFDRVYAVTGNRVQITLPPYSVTTLQVTP
jgi:hypothetical protein